MLYTHNDEQLSKIKKFVNSNLKTNPKHINEIHTVCGYCDVCGDDIFSFLEDLHHINYVYRKQDMKTVCTNCASANIIKSNVKVRILKSIHSFINEDNFIQTFNPKTFENNQDYIDIGSPMFLKFNNNSRMPMYKYKKAELILNHQTGMDTFINECAILKYDENFKNIPLKFKPSEYQKQINKLKVVTSIKRETIKVSRIEKKVHYYLDELMLNVMALPNCEYIHFETNIVFNKKEFDFVITSKNKGEDEIKIAIEVNGLECHSFSNSNKSDIKFLQDYHIKKMIIANENNMNFLSLFSNDIADKFAFENIKKQIETLLNVYQHAKNVDINYKKITIKKDVEYDTYMKKFYIDNSFYNGTDIKPLDNSDHIIVYHNGMIMAVLFKIKLDGKEYFQYVKNFNYSFDEKEIMNKLSNIGLNVVINNNYQNHLILKGVKFNGILESKFYFQKNEKTFYRKVLFWNDSNEVSEMEKLINKNFAFFKDCGLSIL